GIGKSSWLTRSVLIRLKLFSKALSGSKGVSCDNVRFHESHFRKLPDRTGQCWDKSESVLGPGNCNPSRCQPNECSTVNPTWIASPEPCTTPPTYPIIRDRSLLAIRYR